MPETSESAQVVRAQRVIRAGAILTILGLVATLIAILPLVTLQCVVVFIDDHRGWPRHSNCRSHHVSPLAVISFDGDAFHRK